MVIKNRKLLKKQIQKEFLEAKISDNFIFTKVFQKEELLRELIRRILPEVRLGKIKILAREYDVKEVEKGKGIVLDIYVEDEDKMIDIEMQVVNKPKELPNRVRYYQDLMDMDNLLKGEGYGVMKKSYVVFICLFDPLGDNKYLYNGGTRFDVVKKSKYNDGRKIILINTKGQEGKITKELKNLLNYIDGIKDIEDTFIEKIEKQIVRIKGNEKEGRRFMSMRLALYDARQDGILEGEKRGEKRGEINGALTTIKNLMKSLNCDREYAIKIAGIEEDIAAIVRKKIKE